MGENFENAGLEDGEASDDRSTEDEVDSIVAQSSSVRAEDDIDDAGLLRGMLQVAVLFTCGDFSPNKRREISIAKLNSGSPALQNATPQVLLGPDHDCISLAHLLSSLHHSQSQHRSTG